METPQSADLTRLLARSREGDAQAMGAAFAAIYDELRRTACSQLRRMRGIFQAPPWCTRPA